MSPFFPSFLHSNRSSMTSRALLVDPLPKCCSSTIFEFASRWKFIHPEEGRDAFRNHRRFSLLSVSPNNKSIPLSGRKQIKKKRERERKKNRGGGTKKGKKGDKNSAVLGQTETQLCGNRRGEWPWQRKKKNRERGRKNERVYKIKENRGGNAESRLEKLLSRKTLTQIPVYTRKVVCKRTRLSTHQVSTCIRIFTRT